MGKFKIIIILFIIFSFLIPSLAGALTPAERKAYCDSLSPEEKTGGIVPCGRICNDPSTDPYREDAECQLCHIFVLIDRIIDFLLMRIVPIIAALMITIGGFMYIFAYASDSGGPGMLNKANQVFKSVLIGLLIVYGAYLLVGFFLFSVGLTGFAEEAYDSWWRDGVFQVECP